MKKYKTGGWGQDLIEAVEVEKETDKSVWIDGNRSAKRSGYNNYFDSWGEAHLFLLDKAGRKLDSAKFSLQRAQGEYENIKGLKE